MNRIDEIYNLYKTTFLTAGYEETPDGKMHQVCLQMAIRIGTWESKTGRKCTRQNLLRILDKLLDEVIKRANIS